MLKRSFLFWVSMVCILFGLTACGGGGGGGSANPAASTETFQLRAAFVNYLNDSHSYPFNVSGSVSNVSVTGSGTMTQGSLSAANFEGKSAQAKTSTTTGTLTGDGKTMPWAGTQTVYIDSNYNLLGVISADEYEVVSATPLPLTARVNDTGLWYSAIRYSNSSKTRQVGTSTATYVLEPESASTVLLKIIMKELDTGNSVASTNTVTFRMTPAGGLTSLSETLAQGSTFLTIRY